MSKDYNMIKIFLQDIINSLLEEVLLNQGKSFTINLDKLNYMVYGIFIDTYYKYQHISSTKNINFDFIIEVLEEINKYKVSMNTDINKSECSYYILNLPSIFRTVADLIYKAFSCKFTYSTNIKWAEQIKPIIIMKDLSNKLDSVTINKLDIDNEMNNMILEFKYRYIENYLDPITYIDILVEKEFKYNGPINKNVIVIE